MKRTRLFLSTIAAALLMLGGAAVAQLGPSFLVTNLVGTEQVAIVNAGPTVSYATIATIRNSTGYLLTSTATGTVSPTVTVNNLIFTAALTGPVTVALPASPPDGAMFAVNNGTSSSFSQTMTLTTSDTSTLANGSTAVNLAAASSQEWQYTATGKIWYRLR